MKCSSHTSAITYFLVQASQNKCVTNHIMHSSKTHVLSCYCCFLIQTEDFVRFFGFRFFTVNVFFFCCCCFCIFYLLLKTGLMPWPKLFSSSPHSNWLWGPANFICICSGHWNLFTEVKVTRMFRWPLTPIIAETYHVWSLTIMLQIRFYSNEQRHRHGFIFPSSTSHFI